MEQVAKTKKESKREAVKRIYNELAKDPKNGHFEVKDIHGYAKLHTLDGIYLYYYDYCGDHHDFADAFHGESESVLNAVESKIAKEIDAYEAKQFNAEVKREAEEEAFMDSLGLRDVYEEDKYVRYMAELERKAKERNIDLWYD
jgi:hypothetical protein